MAGMQTGNATLNAGDNNAGTNASGTNAGNNGNSDGTGNATGGDSGNNGNAGDGGSADGNNVNGTSTTNGSGNANDFGFVGEFNPEQARNLITTLRAESKAKDSSIKELTDSVTELKELIKGAGIKKDDGNANGDGSNANTSTQTESEALAEIRKLREEMATEKVEAQFVNLATGPAFNMQPSAVAMAWNAVRDSVQVVGGQPTNLTDILANLKQNQAFMFAPVTNGQQVAGSTGSGSNSASGPMPSDLEQASMNAFAFKGTVQEWRALANGQAPDPKA